jgi:DNA gyrase/topoisomerase IV subunit B
MDSLEQITQEVPNAAYKNYGSNLRPQAVIKTMAMDIVNSLSHEHASSFLEGQAKEGLGGSNINTILRNILYKEIDNLQLVNDTTASKITNNKIKKSLKYQVDNIISILELSNDNNIDNRYYLLGLLGKSLS